MSEELMVPSQEWIDASKKKYGKIYKTVLSGDTYVYRSLKRSEYKELQKLVEPTMTQQGPVVSTEQQSQLEEEAAKRCVIWPEDFATSDNKAGVATVIANLISTSSGFEIDEPPVEL